jgi:hypothetical protein
MPVTAATFRRLALSYPDTIEGSHMGHADFRTVGNIFATLPKEGHAMVKLHPEHQHEFMSAEPDAFTPANGAWGRQGCTMVSLTLVKKDTLERAVRAAWQTASTKLSSKKPAPR